MWELIGILVYIILQCCLAGFVASTISTESEFFLGGRSLGLCLSTFSMFATWFGAETCLGSSGAVYAKGFASVIVDPIGCTCSLLITGVVFAYPLWSRELNTLADLYRIRFSRRFEMMVVCLIVPSSLFWSAAQIRAFGDVLHSTISTSDIDPTVASYIIGPLIVLIVIGYTSLGGLLADALNDLLQGSVLIAGLALLLYKVVNLEGGLEPAIATIFEQQKLIVESHGDYSFFSLAQFEAWSVPVFGGLVSQEIVSRILASKSPRVAQTSSIIASLMYVLVGFIPPLLALFGRKWIPNLIESEMEEILPRLARLILPNSLYILFCGALISAILTTIDSSVLAAASLLTHSLFSEKFGKLDESAQVYAARMAVVICGIASFVLAHSADSIVGLVHLAASVGSAGLVPATIFGALTGFGGEYAAISGFIVGNSVFLFGKLSHNETPFIIALIISMFTYISVSLLEKLFIAPKSDLKSSKKSSKKVSNSSFSKKNKHA